MKLKFIIGVVGILSACGFTNAPSLDTTQEEQDNNWVIGPFHRPEGVNPVISPQPTEFYCPMRKQQVKWEESDTFNPAATTKDGKIVVLYRAEDNSAQGIGKRTSRVGYAESKDGIEMKRMASPVLFPAEDNFKDQDWPGGCEDPRVAMTEDGLYVMLYTAWNRKKARLAVATSRDLKNWTKHGLAFDKAYNGRFNDLFCKSGSILTRLKGNQLVIDKVDGKYLMYWGEYAVYAATSDNLIDWYPVLDEKNELHNRSMHISGVFEEVDIENTKVDIRNKLLSFSDTISEKTINHTVEIFSKCGKENCFGRTIVEEITGLKPSGASKLIKLLVDSEVIVPVTGHGKGKYRFQ